MTERAERRAAPRVAFQGEAGAFSEEAIHARFGRSGALPLPCREFQAVADAVREGRAELGMLPVENSIAGGVTGAFDVLARGGLTVLGEIVQPIRHCLLAIEGAEVTDLRRVLSHPVALAQCTRFLSTLTTAESVAIYDTAGAAREVSRRGERTDAAVAGRGAAERYGLSILVEDIQDRLDNQTRFFLVAREEEEFGGPEAGARGSGAAPEVPPVVALPHVPGAQLRKTVLLLETEHRAGALVEVLEPFARAGVSLVHILSRPAQEPWHYRFFLELEAGLDAPAAAAAIDEARLRSHDLKVLGSFDCGVREAARADHP